MLYFDVSNHNFGYSFSNFSRTSGFEVWSFLGLPDFVLYFLYRATIQAPPKPILCYKAYYNPGTYLSSAIPLNYQHNSEH